MTKKAKIKSLIRRTKWAITMVDDFKIDVNKAMKLAKIKEQHVVACRRFGKSYANEHDCIVNTQVVPFVSKDGKTLYVMSMATYEP